LKFASIAALAAARAEGRPVAFAKRLTDAAEFVLPDPQAPAILNDAARAALLVDKTGTQIINGELWFIEVRSPAPRLIVIGAVHIAQALLPFAGMAGFDVTIVDPRRAFGNAARFPDARLIDAWPDLALDQLRPDARTAIVTLTHDPKLDDPALDQALGTPAFYIGALGSAKTHAARLQRLAALGHPPASLARIRGPVGLRIAAVSMPEIALSIIAEIVAVRRGGDILKSPKA